MLRKLLSGIPACCLLFICPFAMMGQQGQIIPVTNSQQQPLKAYRLVLEKSTEDFHDGSTDWDNELFQSYGEHSVYWITSGDKKGQFVYPGNIPEEYPYLTRSSYSHYDYTAQNHLAVEFKKHSRRIAIFKSKYKANSVPLNWESVYFERLLSEYLMDGIYYLVNEDSLLQKGLDKNTRLLIIPAFLSKEENPVFYIDSIFTANPQLNSVLESYTQAGGSIYAEGNGVYFLQKSTYLENGAINYSSGDENGGLIGLSESSASGSLNLAFNLTGGKLYTDRIPVVQSSRIIPTATTSTGNPCVFMLKPENTSGAKILCNTGLPTISGLTDNINQINWTMAAILAPFTFEVDVTRKISNVLGTIIAAGDNAISYDRTDTFTVNVLIRNLSNKNITGITITEKINPWFAFFEVTSGDSYIQTSGGLVFNGISLGAYSEKVITYRLITPHPESILHEDIDKYMDKGTNIAASEGNIRYQNDGYINTYDKTKNYADVMFSALIFADTDVNWKNFLGLDYQPFKVFMNMENKSRSPALNTLYTQYIPKDVPFYWSDNSINIPVLKTPGGKFVDVLHGSNAESNPEFDMDSDGHPDVWLDTTSIYPKGYKITEEEVYWANPWNYLRTGNSDFVFEDIDHDGQTAKDTNGDGVVDVEENGDKIRVWKVTWDIGQVEGYQYHDPYCSYEIWVDPPDLVPLAAGVGYVHESIEDPYTGMFYPYTANISSANKNDTTWSHWMERGDDGKVIWKQLIHQKINNYEGFTFIDTSDVNYHPLPTDSVIGTCPQPHREFLAVLSLGGEEIDMTHYTPHASLYSKMNYSTVFGEERVTPIRTTYTYWAPLPNPLQFEYLSNNFTITDTLGNAMDELPEYGPAKLIFDMDASTEYTYYWIRNVGHDVDYNDPSTAEEGVESMGDGVFGYFVYSIPKGMGGYHITLPRNENGSYKIEDIVSIDGQPFKKWLDNPNTRNEVEIWETPFEYQVYIPQLLIPPALDDNNNDGIDDWKDDRGDRFRSETGYLHDTFMPDDGALWPDDPAEPFIDDIYGKVESGWYAGPDAEYGDDFFENLGKTHITINADYMGRGREGTVEISKGGVLVCEEIFGGSPWVLFSHVLSGFATGTDLSVKSSVEPEIVYYGTDTVYLKHIIADTNEPHLFDANFDPYHISYGYGETTITTFAGAKDPCSLISPSLSMPAIIDPVKDQTTLMLLPDVDPSNPEVAEYRGNVTGAFVEVRVEINNSTADNWINTTVIPEIPVELGSLAMSYVAYPRPLVPSHYSSADGSIIKGDQPNTFTTGWRFNQPEGEVLIKMGHTLNLMQPTRRAYFVFLFKINPSAEKGIYRIPFKLSGSKIHYSGTSQGSISYDVPDAMICIAEKSENGQVSDYEEIILSQSSLEALSIESTDKFVSTGRIKWSVNDFGKEEFEIIPGTLSKNQQGIDLSRFRNFPKADTSQLVILEEGIVDSYNSEAEILRITGGQLLKYTNHEGDQSSTSDPLVVRPIGPRIKVKNSIYSINGAVIADTIIYEPETELYIVTRLTATNTGSDISANTLVNIFPGPYYEVKTDSLDSGCTFNNGLLSIDFGDLTPGEMGTQYLPFLLKASELPQGVDIRTVIEQSQIDYEGTLIEKSFSFVDTNKVLLDLYDFEATSITYNNVSGNQVEVHATVGNRGIEGKNVWVRVYPVIGGGAHEFPFAEIEIENFRPMQSVQISGLYTLPVTDKTIEFLVIVDDGYNYTEITEQNNSLLVSYGFTGFDDPAIAASEFTIYPVPFNDEVHVVYILENDFRKIQLQVFDLNGKLRFNANDCPVNKGIHSLTWRSSALPEGNYMYRMVGVDAAGKENLLQTGIINKKL